MRPYQVGAPGNSNAPCLDESCESPGCASARRLAKFRCARCGEPLGHGRGMIFEEDETVHHEAC